MKSEAIKKNNSKQNTDCLEDKVDKFSQKVQHKAETWKTGKNGSEM